MKNMKIKTKLLIGFAVVIILALALGVVGMVMTSIISGMASEIFDDGVIAIEGLAEIQTESGLMRAHLNRLALYAATGDTAKLEEVEKEYTEIAGKMIRMTDEYGERNMTDEERRIYAEWDGVRGAYGAARAVYIDTLKNASGNGAAISSALDRMMDATLQLQDWLDSLMLTKERAADELNKGSDDMASMAIIIEIVLIILAIGGSVVIALIISGGIEKTLNNIINKLNMASSTISSSAGQLREASENLATGSSKQAAAIEETSATMNETSSMVEQNAENTRVAAQIATEATQAVTEVGKVMGDLMDTMAELKDSSDKVSRIVRSIDDIAFQTNLLAINATVEAARAGGDAGRSFGVVAEEVRNLAQKSANEAAQTTDIIDKNIRLTNLSKTAAEQVMELAQKNAQQTSDLGKLIAEINAASEEQASGIRQINIAISQMESVTQENAAVAEETSAASNSMTDEIEVLEESVRIAESLVTIRN